MKTLAWILPALLALPARAADETEADGFSWNQRAWSSLARGRAQEADRGFERAIDRSSTPATQAEANLGLGLSALIDGRPKVALEPLRRAAIAGPYAIAASAQLTAEADLAIGDRVAALSYLRQALSIDIYNREALRAFARLLDQTGDRRSAWLAARRAQALDPNDSQARKIVKRNASSVPGDPDAAAGVRRIRRPALNPDGDWLLPISTRTIRVGLYGNPSGAPSTLTRCSLMINSPFQIREIVYRADAGAVETRDSARNLLFTSTRPFTFAPASRHGSILIKDALIADAAGVDVGDREMRGALDIIPVPGGFQLVEVAPLELYLYGVVSLALPDGSRAEALKAQAVVSRTAALWAIAHREASKSFDLLDDRSTQASIGVSGETLAAGDAVAATQGQILIENGLVARALQHEDSGGLTEDGIADAPRPAPFDLERFLHEPPPDLFSASAPGPMAAVARWTRILDASDLRSRADVGRLRDLRVVERGENGRVKALEAVGSNGSKTFAGFEEIRAFLSPNSLRSALFALQPLYDGKNLSRVIIWGAGTGSGLGFSRAGAIGQAELGASWRDILKHYFPKAEVRKE